jgi:hypothetical protein
MMSRPRMLCKSGDKIVAELNVFVPVRTTVKIVMRANASRLFHFGGPAGHVVAITLGQIFIFF